MVVTNSLSRNAAVTAADLTPKPQTPQGPDTRWTASIPAVVPVFLDASGRRGSLTVDVPINAVNPPLTADLLKQVKGIRVLIPTPAFGAPFQVKTVNGQKVLRVDIHEADVEALRKCPMTIGLSEQANPTSTAVSRGVLEVRLSSLAVDNSKPELALARQNRADLEAQITQEQQTLAELKNGTSSWFADRSLQTRLEGAQEKLQDAQSRLEAKRAQLEPLLGTASPTAVVKSMPGPTDLSEGGWNTASGLRRAEEAVKQAEEDLLFVAGVPEAEEENRAKLEALTVELGHAQEEWKGWLKSAQSQYQSWKSEEDPRADQWLSSLSFLTHPESRESETGLMDLASSVSIGKELVDSTERELEESCERAAAAVPEVIQESVSRLERLRGQRDELDTRITGLEGGQIRAISSFEVSYPVR